MRPPLPGLGEHQSTRAQGSRKSRETGGRASRNRAPDERHPVTGSFLLCSDCCPSRRRCACRLAGGQRQGANRGQVTGLRDSMPCLLLDRLPGDREVTVKNRPVPSAMPEATNAIRTAFDEDEPPAIVFNESAHPGALISCAWCQLVALDTLLAAVSETRRTAHEKDVAGAARSVLVPAIGALVFDRSGSSRPGASSDSAHHHACRRSSVRVSSTVAKIDGTFDGTFKVGRVQKRAFM